MTVKVVLLEDEELVRSGIRMILESAGDIAVVAEDTDGTRAVELTDRHRPHVVLTDVQMPRVSGLEVVKRLAGHPAAPAVVVLTTFDVDEYVYTALRHGAAGFLLKDTPPRELVTAVRVAARGEAMLSPKITKRLLTDFASAGGSAQAKARLAELTPREHDVAVHIGRGLSNAEIARALNLSESTVKVHIGHIMAKLEAANRTQVAILVHDAGLS
ncbi:MULTISPECIES: response regulator [Amycolatopsis]|uniref:DNA-binding response regulator, NarL/FixJ family, contains REC and HTH domains n=2 Tax=Amycolatopsis TaxID=1813 RepID=A0A1I3MEQ0_9PSEU|nr:response regulator transcription factor [Amycolatopsis sacchari]SFI95448.1 DNA-binding response regulator, NarL/FixJ family, contains REC and HTH domains [Amycolatopsis sacchari]